jgi:hypothetical protein
MRRRSHPLTLHQVIAWLVAFFVVIVGGMRAAQGSAPASLAALFTNPDGAPCIRPCLLGIRPNDTPLREALRLVSAHPLTRALSHEISESSALFTGPGFEIILSVTNDRLMTVAVAIQPPHMPDDPTSPLYRLALGDVLSVLGPTPQVQISWVRGQVMLIYPSDWLYVTTFATTGQEERLHVEDRIAMLLFTAFGEPITLDGYDWLGFTSAARYLSQMGRAP